MAGDENKRCGIACYMFKALQHADLVTGIQQLATLQGAEVAQLQLSGLILSEALSQHSAEATTQAVMAALGIKTRMRALDWITRMSRAV